VLARTYFSPTLSQNAKRLLNRLRGQVAVSVAPDELRTTDYELRTGPVRTTNYELETTNPAPQSQSRSRMGGRTGAPGRRGKCQGHWRRAATSSRSSATIPRPASGRYRSWSQWPSLRAGTPGHRGYDQKAPGRSHRPQKHPTRGAPASATGR